MQQEFVVYPSFINQFASANPKLPIFPHSSWQPQSLEQEKDFYAAFCFSIFFRNRNELAETLALLKAQIDPVLLKNSSQQDSSSRESPSLEEEETKKEEETTKQGFFCVFCFFLFCNFFSFPLFFPPTSIEFPSV